MSGSGDDSRFGNAFGDDDVKVDGDRDETTLARIDLWLSLRRGTDGGRLFYQLVDIAVVRGSYHLQLPEIGRNTIAPS